MKKLIIFLVFTVITAFSLQGCTLIKKESDNTLSHAKLMNKIVVGVKDDSKPFGFIDKDGNLAGFDIDVAHQIAKHIIGDEEAVEFVVVTPRSRILDLNTKKIDMIIAIMSMNESRASVVSFSQPYYVAGQAILVNRNSKINSLNDLNGRNVGFVLGTTGERTIRKLAPGANLRASKTYPEAFKLLKSAEIEAILADDSILYGFISDNPQYKILPKRYTREYYAVAMRPSDDSRDLKEAVDGAINCMQQRGVLNRIKEKWIPSQH